MSLGKVNSDLIQKLQNRNLKKVSNEVKETFDEKSVSELCPCGASESNEGIVLAGCELSVCGKCGILYKQMSQDEES